MNDLAQTVTESLTEQDKRILMLWMSLVVLSILSGLAFASASIAAILLASRWLVYRVGWFGASCFLINGIRLTVQGIFNIEGITRKLMRPDRKVRIPNQFARIFQGIFVSLI